MRIDMIERAADIMQAQIKTNFNKNDGRFDISSFVYINKKCAELNTDEDFNKALQIIQNRIKKLN